MECNNQNKLKPNRLRGVVCSILFEWGTEVILLISSNVIFCYMM